MVNIFHYQALRCSACRTLSADGKKCIECETGRPNVLLPDLGTFDGTFGTFDYCEICDAVVNPHCMLYLFDLNVAKFKSFPVDFDNSFLLVNSILKFPRCAKYESGFEECIGCEAGYDIDNTGTCVSSFPNYNNTPSPPIAPNPT